MTSDIHIGPAVAAVRDLHREWLAAPYGSCSIRDCLDVQARLIVRAHADGNAAAAFHLNCWCPSLVGQGTEKVMQSVVDPGMAREAIAREHGFSDWSYVENNAEQSVFPLFESCVDAVVNGRLDDLRLALRQRPELAREVSRYGHRASLLHYIGANGIESYRQVTPLNAADVTQCLIDAGADVNAIANIYGGSTTLALVTSSAHPNNAGVAGAIVEVLVAAGAR